MEKSNFYTSIFFAHFLMFSVYADPILIPLHSRASPRSISGVESPYLFEDCSPHSISGSHRFLTGCSYVPQDQAKKGFVWDLQPPVRGHRLSLSVPQFYLMAVSESGIAGGYSVDEYSTPNALVWDTARDEATFLSESISTRIFGMNSSGSLLVGQYDDRAIVWRGERRSDGHYQVSVDREVWERYRGAESRPFDAYGMARDVNDSGEVVGGLFGPGSRGMRAFRMLPDGTLQNLQEGIRGIDSASTLIRALERPVGRGSPEGFSCTRSELMSIGLAINNHGVVVGYAYCNGSPPSTYESAQRAFVWTLSSGFMRADTLCGPTCSTSQLLGINTYSGNGPDTGVGTFRTPTGENHAFTVSIGFGVTSFVDLNTITGIREAGWLLETATGISNDGWIVGMGKLNGQRIGYVLIP